MDMKAAESSCHFITSNSNKQNQLKLHNLSTIFNKEKSAAKNNRTFYRIINLSVNEFFDLGKSYPRL